MSDFVETAAAEVRAKVQGSGDLWLVRWRGFFRWSQLLHKAIGTS